MKSSIELVYLIGWKCCNSRIWYFDIATFKNKKTFKYIVKAKDDFDEEYRPLDESDDNENNLQTVGYQRVWSEKDEISILEAYLNYSSYCDILLSFVKDKLEVETTKTQL